MDKQYVIDKVRAIATPLQLLNLLNEIKRATLGTHYHPFTIRQLELLSSPRLARNQYFTFEIPKKSGGAREISAPTGNLKWLQVSLSKIFTALYTPSAYAMGFAEGRSIVDNARMHTNQHYVFNIDLKDFFTSIERARVEQRLQLAPFNFSGPIAHIISGLCTIKVGERAVLPQGAPSSPLLTNAVCDTLDRRLHGLAKRFGLHFSRYADDITFSSMHNVYQPSSDFRKELARIIGEERFAINDAKTRLHHCSWRQEVTGLTVGGKINVSRRFVKDLRAMLHIWEKFGYNAAAAALYPRRKSEKWQTYYAQFTKAPELHNVVGGKLRFLRMVKGANDPVYAKLHHQYLAAMKHHPPTPCSTANIEYVFTLPKAAFERTLGVTIEFRTSSGEEKKPYGCFTYQERYFVVAISHNLDMARMPSDAEISLVQTRSKGQLQPRTGYMLHKPLRGYVPAPIEAESVSEEVKALVMSLAEAFPELHLTDDMGIINHENRQ